MRLNFGGSVYTDGSSNNWTPDSYFSGGTAGSTTSAIANTTDDPIYQAYRDGASFSYAIPLPNAGGYTVTLKFSEPSKTAAGQRKFDVAAEGTLMLDDYDIFAAAGARNKAVDQSFTVTVNDGVLNLAFTGVLDNALVSAVQVVWNGATPPSPTASYLYRGDGLRHSKTVTAGTTTYTWDVNSGMPAVLQDGTYTYFYGHGLISQTESAGTQSYFLSNGLGSTEAITDGTGAVSATYKYDVFGAVRSSTGTGSTEYKYTGEQDDPTLGYTYLRARYYDQATGRFISKDPFQGLLINPTSQHHYSYAFNNPTNWTDPSGEICLPCLGLAAWAAYEVGSSVLDGYSTISIWNDPCATPGEKWLTTGLFAAGLALPGGGGATIAKGLLGRSPGRIIIGQRVNTDLPGGVAVAKSIFRHFTKGQSICQQPLRNGGTRRTAANGTTIRLNPDGSTRIDFYDRGPTGRETVHFSP